MGLVLSSPQSRFFGTWLKSPLWGIILPVPLFMLGHGYDWVGQIDIACFALCMGALVWRSGGLELAILVHAANNTMSFLLAPLTPNSLEQGAVNPAALLFSLPLIFGITAWLWWWVGKQYGVAPPGWREAAGAYGEEGSHRSVADITGPESLAEVRRFKQEQKAAAKQERAARA